MAQRNPYRGLKWPSAPGPRQLLPACPRSPPAASQGQMSSIQACTCPNLSTKRCERPPSKSAAKSMISSCKGSILRSGSAVIHRLTISGRAERDEGTSKNPSSPSPHDPTSMTARGKRRRTPQGDRRCQPAVCCPFVIQDRCGSFCRPTWRRSEGEFATISITSARFLAALLALKVQYFRLSSGTGRHVSRRQN